MSYSNLKNLDFEVKLKELSVFLSYRICCFDVLAQGYNIKYSNTLKEYMREDKALQEHPSVSHYIRFKDRVEYIYES